MTKEVFDEIFPLFFMIWILALYGMFNAIIKHKSFGLGLVSALFLLVETGLLGASGTIHHLDMPTKFCQEIYLDTIIAMEIRIMISLGIWILNESNPLDWI